MPQRTWEKARIALLILVAVLAVTLAMLEAFANTRPVPAAGSRSFLAPSAHDPVLAPSENLTDGWAHSRSSARSASD